VFLGGPATHDRAALTEQDHGRVLVTALAGGEVHAREAKPRGAGVKARFGHPPLAFAGARGELLSGAVVGKRLSVGCNFPSALRELAVGELV